MWLIYQAGLTVIVLGSGYLSMLLILDSQLRSQIENELLETDLGDPLIEFSGY